MEGIHSVDNINPPFDHGEHRDKIVIESISDEESAP